MQLRHIKTYKKIKTNSTDMVLYFSMGTLIVGNTSQELTPKTDLILSRSRSITRRVISVTLKGETN